MNKVGIYVLIVVFACGASGALLSWWQHQPQTSRTIALPTTLPSTQPGNVSFNSQVQPQPEVEPTTRPREIVQSSRRMEQQLNQWITQLADDDADVRQTAQEKLMGLTSANLPDLHAAAAKQLPLFPDQVNALHEVVKQVYLSDIDPLVIPDEGMMGLSWGIPQIVILPDGTTKIVDDENTDGLPVMDRVPGFPAYRYLRGGDLITGVLNFPDINVHSRRSFVDSMKYMHVGDTLKLQIQRGGRTIVVPLQLVPKPQEVADPNPKWMDKRIAAADDYWNQNFADLDPSTTTQPSDMGPATQP